PTVIDFLNYYFRLFFAFLRPFFLILFHNMPRLATRNQKENNKLTSYYELITFYNKLDKQQKEEFRHYLEKVRREKIVPSQVENYLQGLSQDNYAELIVQAKLLLIS